MNKAARFAKIALTVATIFVVGACSELQPPKKTETPQKAEVLTTSTTGQQLDPASHDDVVTAIEEAKRLVPFVLNALRTGGQIAADAPVTELWNKIRIVTKEDVTCEAATDICIDILAVQKETAKAQLLREMTAVIAADVFGKLTGSSEKALELKEELRAKLPAEPKSVLFPRVEVLFQNSHPNTGVLRNAIRRTLVSLEDAADWKVICEDLQSVQEFAQKLGQNQTEKSQMLASLGPDGETEEASILRRTSNLKVYCETPSAADSTKDAASSDLFQNGESLRGELQEALGSLDRIYPAAKEARDLIRTFRL